ncbi:MAG TPA: hypothetical protein VK589_25965 [Chryseolinea sp.]|nr:hypothetical protein [Chryseolinea sp.]
MLKQILTTSLLSFGIVSSLFAQNSADQKRPLMKIDVLIDGKPFTIHDGDTLKYDSKSIVVRTSQYMTFDFEALFFDFPKHFSSEFVHDEGYKTWTLDGNNFVIMYFVFDMPIESDAFIKEMVDKFGKKNCSLSDRRTRLGNIDLAGKRINITLVGVKLTYDIFLLKTNDGKTHYLAFQDTKGDDGSESQEGLEALDVLNKTIKLKQ